MRNDIELIQSLSNAFGPSGHEDDVISLLKEELPPSYSTFENPIRDLFVSHITDASKKTVLLDSHSDEVGFMVQFIEPNGLLHFQTLGRFQKNTLPGSNVLILNDLGKFIKGTISSIPPHYLKGATQELEISDMTIDIGATSSNDVVEKYNISVGNFGVPETDCTYDEKNQIFYGKAFDCRIGVAAMLRVLQKVESKDLCVNVVGSFSSQEEVGDRGAISASNHFKADLAICFEGCPADDTFNPDYKIQAGLKRGPNLRYMDVSVICNPRFMKYAIDLGKEYKIPIQVSVRSGGGNNGSVYTNAGIPTIVIGIPVRYIHSCNCITSYQDFLHAVELATTILENINPDIISKF